MPLYKDEAIILFKRAYGESDRIIRLFAFKSGKLSAIAKGAGKSQKRFVNTLELFNHISIEYFDKNRKGMVRIENADILETNEGIEKSLKRACIAGFFSEFIDRLTKEREPHAELFHLLRGLLKEVRSTEPDYRDLLYYQLRMLDVLGFMPNLESCVHCGKGLSEGEKIYFSNEKGGVICMSCSVFIPHKRFEKDVVPALASIGKRGKTKSTYYDASLERQAQALMEGFIAYHIDVEFKSYGLLKKIL